MTYRPKGMVSFSTCMRSLLRLSNRWKEGVSPVPSSRWRPFDFPPGPASSSVTSTLTFILLIMPPAACQNTKPATESFHARLDRLFLSTPHPSFKI